MFGISNSVLHPKLKEDLGEEDLGEEDLEYRNESKTEFQITEAEEDLASNKNASLPVAIFSSNSLINNHNLVSYKSGDDLDYDDSNSFEELLSSPRTAEPIRPSTGDMISIYDTEATSNLTYVDDILEDKALDQAKNDPHLLRFDIELSSISEESVFDDEESCYNDNGDINVMQEDELYQTTNSYYHDKDQIKAHAVADEGQTTPHYHSSPTHDHQTQFWGKGDVFHYFPYVAMVSTLWPSLSSIYSSLHYELS